MAPAAPPPAPAPGGDKGEGAGKPPSGKKPSLVRQLTTAAEETKATLTKKLTSAVEETRIALERNNTVVSMSSTGVHVISDAGIHLPHQLHLPKTGLSHPLNAALGGATAALVASAAVGPVMTVIDLSIIRAQLQRVTIGQAIKAQISELRSGKARWNPALSVMSGVYLSTYLTANLTEAYCTENGVDYKVPTAVATSIVNIAAIAMKDRAFARMCSKEPAVFPKMSYALMGIRDGMTVTSSFVLKNAFRDYLVEEHEFKPRNADLAASFIIPMAAQIPSTPVHILALDLFARKNVTFGSRMAEVAKGYMSVCSGRVIRVLPAFGIGGVVNDMVKEAFEDEEEEMFLHMDRPPTR